jgi:hypothetical protein
VGRSVSLAPQTYDITTKTTHLRRRDNHHIAGTATGDHTNNPPAIYTPVKYTSTTHLRRRDTHPRRRDNHPHRRHSHRRPYQQPTGDIHTGEVQPTTCTPVTGITRNSPTPPLSRPPAPPQPHTSPPLSPSPPTQPPATSATYAANTCIRRNALRIAASLSTPISPDIAPLMRYLPIMRPRLMRPSQNTRYARCGLFLLHGRPFLYITYFSIS